MEILLFFIGIPCILPFISHLSMKELTKKERQELDLPQNRNLRSLVQKAALGFKITATIFFLAIILLCLLNFPQKAEDYLLFIIIVTPLMFLSFYPIFFINFNWLRLSFLRYKQSKRPFHFNNSIYRRTLACASISNILLYGNRRYTNFGNSPLFNPSIRGPYPNRNVILFICQKKTTKNSKTTEQLIKNSTFFQGYLCIFHCFLVFHLPSP